MRNIQPTSVTIKCRTFYNSYAIQNDFLNNSVKLNETKYLKIIEIETELECGGKEK